LGQYKDKDLNDLVNKFIGMKDEFNRYYSVYGLISVTNDQIQVNDKLFSKLAYHYQRGRPDQVRVIGVTDGGIHLQTKINKVSFVTVAGGY